MKQQERSQSVVTLLLGLIVVIVLIVTSISTLDRFSQNKAFPVQPTGIPTTVAVNTATPIMSGTQTMTFLMTQKAVLVATILSITRTPFPTHPWSTGTSVDDSVKFTGQKMWGLDVLNGWFGLVDGYMVSFYAGSLLEDPEQGAIAFLIQLPYRNDKQNILTPTRHGGVHVIAEQNNRLTLQAVDGEIFYFDVPARQFVASLTEVVPTATPLPTLTPKVYGVFTPIPTYNPYPMPVTLMPTSNPYPMPVEPGTEAP